MKKQFKRLLSLSLVLCLLLSAAPVQAASQESLAEPTQSPAPAEPELSATQAAPATPSTPVAEEVTVLWEDETLRGEYEKHFLMSDGSYQAVVYSYPVHELVDGVWVELPAPEQIARGDVSPDSARSNIIDNYVWENHGVQDNNSVRLYIGNRTGYKCRAFIRFATMPTIPAGATITAATMTVNMVSGTSTANNATAYQVEGPWESDTIQWSNMPTLGTLQAANISHNNKTKYQFSCLEAVQEWYVGSTTGQNENYGIMLRYSNETIADYNSVYSADCTDANSRPSLTISYTPANSSLNVEMGGTLTLTLPDVAGTITWISEDAAIATVNSVGAVSGHKVGEVKIKAYVDGVEYQIFTVHVTLPNGVYRLQNSDLYMGTYGGVTENTSARLLASATNAEELIRQLWKITYLGNGRYTIRPMHKLNMALHADGTIGSTVDIVDGGVSDNYTTLSPLVQWGISVSADGNAYYLNHVGTGSMGLRAEDDTASLGLGLTTGINNGTLSAFRWSMTQVTGVFMHDQYCEPTNIPAIIQKEVEMGGTYTPAQMGFYVTTSNVNLTWTSSDTNILTVNSEGKVTAHKRGVADITASGSANGEQYQIKINITSIETVYVKNFYDSTYAGNTEKINKISTAVSFLNLVYYNEFQLKFVMDGSPVRYEQAGIDICTNGLNECNSSCGSSCKSHHKNVFRIAEELYKEYFDANHIVVLWSDSIDATYCGSRSDLHFPCIAMAVTVPLEEHPSPIIQVFSNVSNNEMVSMSINLAHEVAHTLGLKEIYNNDYEDDSIVNGKTWHDDGSVTSNMCIMKHYDGYDASELYTKTIDGHASALCDYCIGKLHTEAIQDRDLYES